MTHEEIISQLRDIHGAPSPSFWPLAPGYYLVAFAIILVVVLILAFRRVWGRTRVRKLMLGELALIEEQFGSHQDLAELQASISALFRRLAFFAEPKLIKNADFDRVLPVLARVMADQKRMQTIVDILNQNRFSKNPNVDGPHLINLSREQIKQCRI